jgi:hypothetical protein
MQFSSQYINDGTLTKPTPIENISIPKSKKLVKQELQQAFNDGKLAFRTVQKEQENNYLKQENKSPRPVSQVGPNIPTKMRLIHNADTIGIINHKTLFSFKHSSVTDHLKYGATLEYCCKKNIPDNKSLLEKQYELANRKWETYKIATSGHLKADGYFSLPKLKGKIETNYIHKEVQNDSFVFHNMLCIIVFFANLNLAS